MSSVASVAEAMAGTWAPAQSLQQVPAAAAEIASVLGSEELLDQVRCRLCLHQRLPTCESHASYHRSTSLRWRLWRTTCWRAWTSCLQPCARRVPGSCTCSHPGARLTRSSCAQVTEDVQSQQVALEPAFRNITAGLARDFAYVDGVGVRQSAVRPSLPGVTRPASAEASACAAQDALVNMRVAVQRMEATITAAEANLWRCAPLVESVVCSALHLTRRRDASGNKEKQKCRTGDVP